MSFALTQLRTPVSAKALGLVLAALALGSGSTIATVATASHQRLPAATSHAPQQTTTSTTSGQGSTGTSTSDSNTSSSGTNQASSNAFGQQVVQQVNTCKAQAATAGTHGIGQCVSGWVLKHNPGAAHHTH
jgi:hypothetical protein